MTTTLEITPVKATANNYRFTPVQVRDGVQKCLTDLVDLEASNSCEVRIADLTNAYNSGREPHEHLPCTVVFQATAELRAELGTGFSYRWDCYPRNALRVFTTSGFTERQPGVFSQNDVHKRGEIQARLAAVKNSYIDFLQGKPLVQHQL